MRKKRGRLKLNFLKNIGIILYFGVRKLNINQKNKNKKNEKGKRGK